MKNIKSIYYHNPDPIGFERMIRYYKNRNYSFISIKELCSIIQAKRRDCRKLVFVSLDDGWRCNLDLIPIIEKYKVPICIFVATEPLISGNFWWEYVLKERGLKKMIEFKSLPYEDFIKELTEIKNRLVLQRSSLTEDEVRSLSSHPLVSIQSHTVTHPILTSLQDNMLDMEMSVSKQKLEELVKDDIFAFSYPNGSFTEREMTVCSKYYTIAFSTEQKHICLTDNRYKLPRYALTGAYYRDLLKVWGIWKYLKRIQGIFRKNSY